MLFETLLVEQRGPVTLLTLNRPHVLNALNDQVLRDLSAAFAAYSADDSQRCAVLTGSARAFAAGTDIKEVATKAASELFLQDFFSDWQAHIAAVRTPWIAAVAGYALGGGCELAMMADFIIAADTARFGQPEIKLGVAPSMGGRSEEHTYELQSLMRISYAVFCLKKKNKENTNKEKNQIKNEKTV